jgi:hypothetical protein
MRFWFYAAMALYVATLTIAASSVMTRRAAADPVPCEDMLARLRDTVASAKASDAGAAKIKELQDKGIERCNADDDQRADDFFTQALQILGK